MPLHCIIARRKDLFNVRQGWKVVSGKAFQEIRKCSNHIYHCRSSPAVRETPSDWTQASVFCRFGDHNQTQNILCQENPRSHSFQRKEPFNVLLAQVVVGRHDEGAKIESDEESNEPLVGNRLPLDGSWTKHGINERLLVCNRLCRQPSLRDKSFEHRSVPLRRMIPGRIIGKKTSSFSTRLEQGLRIVDSFHGPVHCQSGR